MDPVSVTSAASTSTITPSDLDSLSGDILLMKVSAERAQILDKELMDQAKAVQAKNDQMRQLNEASAWLAQQKAMFKGSDNEARLTDQDAYKKAQRDAAGPAPVKPGDPKPTKPGDPPDKPKPPNLLDFQSAEAKIRDAYNSPTWPFDTKKEIYNDPLYGYIIDKRSVFGSGATAISTDQALALARERAAKNPDYQGVVTLLENQKAYETKLATWEATKADNLKTYESQLSAWQGTQDAYAKDLAAWNNTVKTIVPPDYARQADQWAKLGIDQKWVDKLRTGDIQYKDVTAMETALKSKTDSLSSSVQMDMIRLQALSNRRDEAYTTITNLLKKLNDSIGGILSNLR